MRPFHRVSVPLSLALLLLALHGAPAQAATFAVGVTTDGRRTILGVSVSLSEAEVHWREFLAGLQARGLHGVRLVTSDDHAEFYQAFTNKRDPEWRGR